MEEKMEEDIVEEGFQFLEIDLDYEFDASRFFDFSRIESLFEMQEAERWFETAGSYPPSPYIAKLHSRENVFLENANNTVLKHKDFEYANATSISDISARPAFSGQTENSQGLTLYNPMAEDIPIAETKNAPRAPFSRCSTLMKPTASHLAKQSKPCQVKNRGLAERYQKQSVLKNERSLENPSGVESQAAKRQKLEGGHLIKVVHPKQQTNLRHKVPQQGSNSDQSRLKLTIPREPELRTALRAQRVRPRNCMDDGDQASSTMSVFRARPLNRKILRAPSLPPPQRSMLQLPEFQEFHLKTYKRAVQYVSSATSSLLHSDNSDKVAVNHKTSFISQIGATQSISLQNHALVSSQHQAEKVTDDMKREDGGIVPKFKARPLNKKIFSSKGDIGVFRPSKQETTTPMEFNFSTEVRFQNPPIELFNKLSLTSELKQTSQSDLSQPVGMLIKGSKENRINYLQEEHKTACMSKETLQRLARKQVQCGSGGMTEIRNQTNLCRSIGIR